MYALFFIAKNNLKKKKGDAVVLFLLSALAALLFYVSSSILTSTDQVLDQAYEKWHTADYTYITAIKGEEAQKQLEEIFRSREEVTEVEVNDCLQVSDAKYRGAQSKEKKEYPFLLGVIEPRNICKLPELEGNDSKDAILLPFYMKASEGYETGDPFYLTLGLKEYSFTVAGFVQDPMLATPLNVSIYSCYISRDAYEEILTDPSMENCRWKQYKVRLKEGEDSTAFDEEISPYLMKKIPEISGYSSIGLAWEAAKGGDAMLSGISMSIILVFSILLILIAVIIIWFSIHNFMEMNLKNIGILQACGYTIRQLKRVSVLEMGMLSASGIFLGILFGIFGNRFIGSFQGIMIGISWNQGINPLMAVMAALATFGVMTAVSALASMGYQKVTVLDALRGGIHTHNFRKNYFPFEKSRLPQSMVLAGKQIMGEKRKNASILCIIALLSFATCAAFAIYENFVLHTDNLMKIVGIEGGNVGVTGTGLKSAGEQMEKWAEVEQVLYYDVCDLSIGNGENQMGVPCDIWEEPSLLQNEILLKGRLPEYDNEIVLTTNVAERLKVTVGDVVYVEGSKGKKDYIVSGIDQKINHMGIKSMLNSKGAKRLNGEERVSSLYLCTAQGVGFETIQKKISSHFPDYSTTETQSQIDETMSGIKVGMSLICVVFVLITLFVVSMIILLLVKTRLVKEQKMYGISKALGYTTPQLILQTMMMNMPVLCLGTVIGVIVCLYLMNPVVVACLSFCGIKKCDMVLSPHWMVLTVAGITAWAAVVSVLAAARIRNIQPVKMLTEE